ncbi:MULTISPECIES: MFS transporter [Sphingobacterium]|uniref:MFS transporter n=1 Tax=Sphingobacterium populi TaxID=1812824 RepID=A0ABW5UDK3_9SPHI|nr:MFS transporter [Sphingobacterium sp. CFCC 11742]
MGSKVKGNYRWVICGLLFFATTINYLDRQVLSLTWKDFIAPEFHWTNNDYGNITALFAIFYAISMLVAGRFVDLVGTKKGFLWAIGVWSVGAILHAFCGIATAGITAGEWFVGFEGAKEAIGRVHDFSRVVNVSVVLFIFARFVLAVGEAGNFPAAIKTVAEYFPKKDRALSTSIFNAGTTIGALAAPLTIPYIAKILGWEMAFIIIGALGFIWMGFWIFMYDKPENNIHVSAEELAYIQQDEIPDTRVLQPEVIVEERKVTITNCLKHRQTWAYALGKFMTDGVWWFLLFWMPAYLSSVYGIKSSDFIGQIALFVLYSITMLSIIGGWLPTYFVDRLGLDPYAGRMRAMLIFAFFPLVVLFAQPLGELSFWYPVVLIGIGAAAHQSWSANLYSVVGDMFPKRAIATVTGIGGLAGGIGAFLINKASGMLFDYSERHWSTINGTSLQEAFPQFQNTETEKIFLEQHGVISIEEFLGQLASTGNAVSNGINTGYLIIFSFCAVAYLLAWVVMKTLVPRMKQVEL